MSENSLVEQSRTIVSSSKYQLLWADCRAINASFKAVGWRRDLNCLSLEAIEVFLGEDWSTENWMDR